jgi:hypothetical protein
MPGKRKITEKAQLKLYVPEALRRRLEAAAKRNARPLNGEMIHRLQQTFGQEDRLERDNALIDALVGGGRNAEVLRMVALAMQMVPEPPENAPSDWRIKVLQWALFEIVKAGFRERLGSVWTEGIQATEKRGGPIGEGAKLAYAILSRSAVEAPEDHLAGRAAS